jgi:TM2 domain-containing membrane protein YozV
MINLYALFVRLVALFAGVLVLSQVFETVALFINRFPIDAGIRDVVIYFVAILIPLILPLIGVGMLWKYSEKLIAELISTGIQQSIHFSLPLYETFRVALFVVGIFLLAESLPILARAGYVIQQQSLSVGEIMIAQEQIPNLVEIFVRVSMGLSMIIFSKKLARFLSKQ